MIQRYLWEVRVVEVSHCESIQPTGSCEALAKAILKIYFNLSTC